MEQIKNVTEVLHLEGCEDRRIKKKGKTKKNDTFLNPFLDMVKVYFEIFIF